MPLDLLATEKILILNFVSMPTPWTSYTTRLAQMSRIASVCDRIPPIILSRENTSTYNDMTRLTAQNDQATMLIDSITSTFDHIAVFDHAN